jgi:predicted signal transduction protein with EAL and GGDEF domain
MIRPLPCGVVTTIADITTRREDEEQLRLALTVFRNSVEAIIVTDAEERILSVNRAFTEVTGYSAEEAWATPRACSGPGTTTRVSTTPCGATSKPWASGRARSTTGARTARFYPSALSISAVRDTQERITHYVAVFSDITERKASEARIAYLAQHDPLTGLPNRTLLQDRLDQALAHAVRHGSRIAVLFLDLDRFKTINDSLGHMTGDRLLQGVALRLSAARGKPTPSAARGATSS